MLESPEPPAIFTNDTEDALARLRPTSALPSLEVTLGFEAARASCSIGQTSSGAVETGPREVESFGTGCSYPSDARCLPRNASTRPRVSASSWMS